MPWMWSASAWVAMTILQVDRLKSICRISSTISSTVFEVADVDEQELAAAVDEVDVDAQAAAGLVVHLDDVGKEILPRQHGTSSVEEGCGKAAHSRYTKVTKSSGNRQSSRYRKLHELRKECGCSVLAFQPRSRGLPRSGIGLPFTAGTRATIRSLVPFTGLLAVWFQPIALRAVRNCLLRLQHDWLKPNTEKIP